MKRFNAMERLEYLSDYGLRLRSMERFQSQSPEAIDEYQLRRIRQLIALAYERTGFYRKVYDVAGAHPNDIRTWDDFRKLPTVSKSEIIEAGKDCIVETALADKTQRITRSSGSSGEVLGIATSTDFWIGTALGIIRMYRTAFDVRPFGRSAWIYCSTYPFQSKRRPFRFDFIHTLSPPSEIMERLEQIKPRFVTGYASILAELAALYPERCRALKLEALSTNSEQSTQDYRDGISDVFRAPVFDEYSTEEMALGAFQCRNLRYHLQEQTAYFEVLDADSSASAAHGEVGELVGTCLINETMPFIRYRQGDLGSIAPSSCACGDSGRELKDIIGRKNADFLLNDGKRIPSGRVLDWSYRLLLELNIPMRQFRITQVATDLVDMELVCIRPLDVDQTHKISASFEHHFENGLRADVRLVESIPRTPAGKHLPIRSMLTDTGRQLNQPAT